MDTTLLLSSGGGRSGEWIHCTSLRETRVGPPRGEKQRDPPLEDVHVAVDADVDVVEGPAVAAEVGLEVLHLLEEHAAVAGEVAVDLARLVADVDDDELGLRHVDRRGGRRRRRDHAGMRGAVGKPALAAHHYESRERSRRWGAFWMLQGTIGSLRRLGPVPQPMIVLALPAAS
jgi:hypothetical protein